MLYSCTLEAARLLISYSGITPDTQVLQYVVMLGGYYPWYVQLSELLEWLYYQKQKICGEYPIDKNLEDYVGVYNH